MNSQNELLVTLILSDSLFMKYMYDFEKREKKLLLWTFFSFIKWKYAKLTNPCFYNYRDLSYGKGAPIPLKDTKIANIEKTEPWDGKDGEVIKKISVLGIWTIVRRFRAEIKNIKILFMVS